MEQMNSYYYINLKVKYFLCPQTRKRAKKKKSVNFESDFQLLKQIDSSAVCTAGQAGRQQETFWVGGLLPQSEINEVDSKSGKVFIFNPKLLNKYYSYMYVCFF